MGTLLGTKLISNEWGIWSAILYIDNRASILATQLTKPTAGHYIFDTFHKFIETLKKRHNIHVTVQWVPGHKGVEGNKRADEQAKKAIMEGSNDKRQLPKLLRKTLPHSRSAAKWAFGETLKRNAQKLWQKSPRYTKMKKTDPTTPSNKYLKLITNLP